jgi:hypothetical protein
VQRYVRVPSECSTAYRSEKKTLPTAVSSPQPMQGSFADDAPSAALARSRACIDRDTKLRAERRD